MSDTAAQPVQITKWGQWDFQTHKLNGHLKIGNIPGIYIYSKIIDCQYFPIYIGEAENLRVRIKRHNYESVGIYAYSEYIHLRDFPGIDYDRKQIEYSLIAMYNPPLNIKGRTGPASTQIAETVPDWWLNQ